MPTYHIHINGIVQGVGFRPLIHQLACDMMLKGYVRNGNDGVHVIFNAAPPVAAYLFEQLTVHPPQHARIIAVGMDLVDDLDFPDFSIVVSDDTASRLVCVAPDQALCDRCRRELHDPGDRRYRYPFITCTQCGPRYSIMQFLPYERPFTSMDKFPMCGPCLQEYNDISGIRFYAQTNSCGSCGIRLQLRDNDPSNGYLLIASEQEAVLSLVRTFLDEGKIVAVKGIGGYLLLCDAADASAIRALRRRKNRPRKPLAVLFPAIDKIKENFQVSSREEQLLRSPEAPIVLLTPHALNDHSRGVIRPLALDDIAPGLFRVGIMLPYNPLLDLIVTDFGKPLIATSANIAGSPIVYKDSEALACLSGMTDHILSHDREIAVPLDDSVVRVSTLSRRSILLRRSRGYAPSFPGYKPVKNIPILATGAFLKGSFTATAGSCLFVSQFLGSAEGYESQQMYKETLENWLNLYRETPRVIVSDMHPEYFSHVYGNELALRFGAGSVFVQHHEAHFAAVLGEFGLLDKVRLAREGEAGPLHILGVIWDGTGLGYDGNIWGGEFFVYEDNEMTRFCHLDYFPLIAADKPAREPRLAALCVLQDDWVQVEGFKDKFTDMEWHNYRALLRDARLFSSSVGRIFDAVACLLNVCDKQTYEGEAALGLQVLAEEYIRQHGFEMDDPYPGVGANGEAVVYDLTDGYAGTDLYGGALCTRSWMKGIVTDLSAGKPAGYIAAKFHYSLACLIGRVAEAAKTRTICCSGGVFQNALLVDWVCRLYGGSHDLYFHEQLSPNDENISFGQYVFYDHDIKSNQPIPDSKSLNLTICV